MKRQRENDTIENENVKKRRKLPTNHALHQTLRKLGLPVSGNKATMMRRLTLNRWKKSQLREKVLELCPGVHIPLGIVKKDLVVLIPKFESAHEMTVDQLKSKLERNHHYVHEMPASSALKAEYITAFVEAMLYKTVGVHAESDEEAEINALYTRKDLLGQLNNIDPVRIRFNPYATKDELIDFYQRYILDINEMTKKEVRAVFQEKFPDHLPLTTVRAKDHRVALARCLFHEEFGGEIVDNPKDLHVDQLKEQIQEKGMIKLGPELHRKELLELYSVFCDNNPRNMTKHDIRNYCDVKGIPHSLTMRNKKQEHIDVLKNYYKTKYHIEGN